jgi:SHS2 domain-containing protein
MRNPLDHTADTGLEAAADTLPNLISELGLGMFELMGDVEDCSDGRSVQTTVESRSVEDLIVDSLSELLYLSETEGLHLCRFDVRPAGDNVVLIEAKGIPTEDAEATGPPIKAVTYHQLTVSETNDGWTATVYFDV